MEEESEKQRIAGQRILRRRQVLRGVFFLGTVVAALGWYIDIIDASEFNPVLGRLTLLALVGHALQVFAVFALLVLPEVHDESE
jgi:hypothetical protein